MSEEDKSLASTGIKTNGWTHPTGPKLPITDQSLSTVTDVSSKENIQEIAPKITWHIPKPRISSPYCNTPPESSSSVSSQGSINAAATTVKTVTNTSADVSCSPGHGINDANHSPGPAQATPYGANSPGVATPNASIQSTFKPQNIPQCQPAVASSVPKRSIMGDYSSGSSSSGSDYSSGSSSEDEEPIIIKNGSQRLVLNLNGEVPKQLMMRCRVKLHRLQLDDMGVRKELQPTKTSPLTNRPCPAFRKIRAASPSPPPEETNQYDSDLSDSDSENGAVPNDLSLLDMLRSCRTCQVRLVDCMSKKTAALSGNTETIFAESANGDKSDRKHKHKKRKKKSFKEEKSEETPPEKPSRTKPKAEQRRRRILATESSDDESSKPVSKTDSEIPEKGIQRVERKLTQTLHQSPWSEPIATSGLPKIPKLRRPQHPVDPRHRNDMYSNNVEKDNPYERIKQREARRREFERQAMAKYGHSSQSNPPYQRNHGYNGNSQNRSSTNPAPATNTLNGQRTSTPSGQSIRSTPSSTTSHSPTTPTHGGPIVHNIPKAFIPSCPTGPQAVLPSTPVVPPTAILPATSNIPGLMSMPLSLSETTPRSSKPSTVSLPSPKSFIADIGTAKSDLLFKLNTDLPASGDLFAEPDALDPDPVMVSPPPNKPVFSGRKSLLPEPSALLPEPKSLLPEPKSLLPDPYSLLPKPASLLPKPTSLLPDPSQSESGSTSSEMPPTKSKVDDFKDILDEEDWKIITQPERPVRAHQEHRKEHKRRRHKHEEHRDEIRCDRHRDNHRNDRHKRSHIERTDSGASSTGSHKKSEVAATAATNTSADKDYPANQQVLKEIFHLSLAISKRIADRAVEPEAPPIPEQPPPPPDLPEEEPEIIPPPPSLLPPPLPPGLLPPPDEDFQQYSQEEEYVGEQVEYCCDQDYGSQEYQEGLQYAEQAYAGDQTYEMVEGEVYAEEGYATNEQSSLYPVPDDGNIMYQDHTAEEVNQYYDNDPGVYDDQYYEQPTTSSDYYEETPAYPSEQYEGNYGASYEEPMRTQPAGRITHDRYGLPIVHDSERKASKAIEYKQKASKVNERCRDPGKTTPSCVGSDSQKPVMNERNCADSSGAKRCQINFVKPAISTDVKTEMTMEVSRNRKTVNQYDKMKNHLSKQWLVHKIPIPDKIKTGLTVSSAKPVSDGAGRHKVLVGKVESPQLNSVVDTEHLSDDEMLNKKTEPACSTEDRFIDKEERRNIEDRFTSRDASMYIFRQAIRKESATGQSSIIPGHSSISDSSVLEGEFCARFTHPLTVAEVFEELSELVKIILENASAEKVLKALVRIFIITYTERSAFLILRRRNPNITDLNSLFNQALINLHHHNDPFRLITAVGLKPWLPDLRLHPTVLELLVQLHQRLARNLT